MQPRRRSSTKFQQLLPLAVFGVRTGRTAKGYPVGMDCIFCRIVSGEVPAVRLYEDEHVIAFADVAPKAPTHFLVIPRQHVVSLRQVARKDAPLLGHLLSVAAELAREQGLTRGFRTVINSGEDGGQTVDHLHLHVLGGRPMQWPPG